MVLYHHPQMLADEMIEQNHVLDSSSRSTAAASSHPLDTHRQNGHSRAPAQPAFPPAGEQRAPVFIISDDSADDDPGPPGTSAQRSTGGPNNITVAHHRQSGAPDSMQDDVGADDFQADFQNDEWGNSGLDDLQDDFQSDFQNDLQDDMRSDSPRVGAAGGAGGPPPHRGRRVISDSDDDDDGDGCAVSGAASEEPVRQGPASRAAASGLEL